MDPFMPFPNDLLFQPPLPASLEGVRQAVAAAKATVGAQEPEATEQARRKAVLDTILVANQLLAADPAAESLSMAWVGTSQEGKAKGYLVREGHPVSLEEGGAYSAEVRALPRPVRTAVTVFLQQWQRLSAGMSPNGKQWLLDQAFSQPLTPGSALYRIEANTPVPAPRIAPRGPRP